MRHFDLCVIGSGSGNSILDDRFADLDVALVEKGTFGGTCLNVGCIPTKMFVYPADLATGPEHASRLGVDLELSKVHWPAIRDRIFGRIDPISAGGKQWREENDNITLYTGEASFIGAKTLDTGTGETLTADRFVIAAGSRVSVPPIPGLRDVRFYTSDTVMRLDTLPASIVILGGGFVAAEFAHVFSSFGTAVTVVNRSGALLRKEDGDVSRRFTQLLSERVNVVLNHDVDRVVEGVGAGVSVSVSGPGPHGSPAVTTLEADVLLVATGRVPNGDTLNLAAAGVATDGEGYVIVDPEQRTSAEGVFSLGDVSSHHQLKHVANANARVVQHNLLNPDSMVSSDERFVPHAVFSGPQVASVGVTEEQAKDRGIEYVTATQDYGDIAYGWAMEDQDHFCKLLADPTTGHLLGAHLIGPQASSLIQPLIQAMSFGLPVHQMARGQYWIHPAMSELLENALLALPLKHDS